MCLSLRVICFLCLLDFVEKTLEICGLSAAFLVKCCQNHLGMLGAEGFAHGMAECVARVFFLACLSGLCYPAKAVSCFGKVPFQKPEAV